MPRKGDIPATRIRPKEELLFGLWHDGEDAEAELDGYDASQRNEIIEVLGDAPEDGLIQTVLLPDTDDEDENWG